MKKTSLIVMAALLGLLSLGIFAGCTDFLSGPAAGTPKGGPGGTGQVLISLGPRAEGARTFMPVSGNYGNLSYTYTFSAGGKNPVSGAFSNGEASAVLEEGTWTLTVEGSDNNGVVLEGIVRGIEINPGATSSVTVPLSLKTGSPSQGRLHYSVSFPDGVNKGSLAAYHWESGKLQGTVDLLLDGRTGDLNLPAGYYRIALDLYMNNGLYSRTDIAHICAGMTTETGEYNVDAADFIRAEEASSLAEVLDAVSGLQGHTTYLLSSSAIPEPMPTKTVTSTNPVTIIVDGGGREVTLSENGSLITVGNNVTLILKNITLQGGDNNTAALIKVISGGTLELGTGVRVTGNKHSSSSGSYYSPEGGGVYVDSNGSFIMSGGEISGNTASSTSSSSYSTPKGSGVYVGSNGSFIMSGGEISDNKASSTSTSSDSSSAPEGGGVYVGSNGSFIMSGGLISGNTATSTSPSLFTSAFGGGVYVDSNGSFSMNGGAISGNTASSSVSAYGGGVYVYSNGSFSMSGGLISGNKASHNDPDITVPPGGGVHVNRGTFTMSGGEISGNANGGVYVDLVGASSTPSNAIFTMDGGKISGNTGTGVRIVGNFTLNDGEISGNIGTGVYVGGTLTMNGGLISGNTPESTYSVQGGGVFASTFIMNDGLISGNKARSYYNALGGGVYAYQDFTMNGGVISGNTAESTTASAYGGGVFVELGTFTKQPGGIIYGSDAGSTLRNTAITAFPYNVVGAGDAVYVYNLSPYHNSPKKRSSTVGAGVTLDSSVYGTSGEWESSTVSGITYSGSWAKDFESYYKSPELTNTVTTKERIDFTGTGADASITILLEVQRGNNSDFAFISRLDNSSALYDTPSSYYVRIPFFEVDTWESVMVTIPFNAGSHFVEIHYREPFPSQSEGYARFKVLE